MPWQSEFVEVTDLSSLSRRFYVPPKFVFISLSLVNQKVITGSSNPFSCLLFIAIIYFRPTPHTCWSTRHGRIYLSLNVTHFYKPLKGQGGVYNPQFWPQSMTVERRSKYRQNHQSPFIRVLKHARRPWWMFSTARLQRPTRQSSSSAASMNERLTRRVHYLLSVKVGRRMLRPTSQRNAPRGWCRAENISTYLRDLSGSAKFLIFAADSFSAGVGAPPARDSGSRCASKETLWEGDLFHLRRSPGVFHQVRRPAKHAKGEDRALPLVPKNDCALVQSNLNFRLGQPV